MFGEWNILRAQQTFSCKTTFLKIARKLQEPGNKQNKIKEN